ncbi:MAG: hypothetical protein WAW11_02605 [Patescibacteria group bacterium]
MEVSLREKRFYIISFALMIVGCLVGLIANTWYAFTESPESVKLMNSAYLFCFLGCSVLISIFLGRLIANISDETDILAAMVIFMITAGPASTMTCLFTRLLIEPTHQSLAFLIDEHMCFLSFAFPLSLSLMSFLWFLSAKKLRKRKLLLNPTSQN